MKTNAKISLTVTAKNKYKALDKFKAKLLPLNILYSDPESTGKYRYTVQIIVKVSEAVKTRNDALLDIQNTLQVRGEYKDYDFSISSFEKTNQSC